MKSFLARDLYWFFKLVGVLKINSQQDVRQYPQSFFLVTYCFSSGIGWDISDVGATMQLTTSCIMLFTPCLYFFLNDFFKIFGKMSTFYFNFKRLYAHKFV